MQIASTLPMRSDFHVVPDGYLWKVTQEHRAMPYGHTLTKIEALSMGIQQARAGHVSLVIHGRDGRVQNVWSYDNWAGPRDVHRGAVEGG